MSGNGSNGNGRPYSNGYASSATVTGLLVSIILMAFGLCGYLVAQEHTDEISIAKLTAVSDVYGEHLHVLDARVDELSNQCRQVLRGSK